MCGIAGFVGEFYPKLLDGMGHVIGHRGPDDSGKLYLGGDRVGLVHKRLSIIDTSSAGHQPMVTNNGDAIIVYNGEIYNYLELRRELEDEGVHFNSQSDTEVLLNLYLKEHHQVVSRLNGIFAFAIWDKTSRELFLARDGVGVKPLYLSQLPKGFLFASELKALLLEPSLSRELNGEAIYYYLAHLWAPSPHTMLRHVEKLEPGYALVVRDGRIRAKWKFYDFPYDLQIKEDPAERTAEGIAYALRRAVDRQLVADVSVGAFLSGGLDSSAVVAMMRKAWPDKCFKCFSIGFDSRVPGYEGLTEDLPYARSVAAQLGVDLEVVTVGSGMIEKLKEMIYHLDEPQADPAALNVLLICQLARDRGIKVLLSGAGGDDIFSGYRRHLALTTEMYWSWLPSGVRKFIKHGAGQLPVRAPWSRRLRKALEYADKGEQERIASYFLWLNSDRVLALMNKGLVCDGFPSSVSPALSNALGDLPKHTSRLNQMLYLDGRFFLPDHNLNYTDKMSMATGVEVRVPLLDPDLIKLATQLPSSFKQHGATGKWIFKRAMRPYLSHDVIHRPKTGFGAPLRYWLHNDLKPLMHDTLSRDVVIKRGIFNPDEIFKLIKDDEGGKIDAAYTIFALICVEVWCRLFLDQTPGKYALNRLQ